MTRLPTDAVHPTVPSTIALDGAPQPNAISLLVVSDVRLYRESIASALTQRETITVRGSACSAEDALRQFDSLQPRVVIIDMTMKDSLACICGLVARGPEAKVLAFAVDEGGSDVISCVEAGIAGYISCEASIDDLALTIESVVRGESPCSPRVAAALFQRLAAIARTPQQDNARVVLTLRERQVLELVRKGLSNKEIARDLNIEVATVKNHIHHVLSKLNVTTRAEAASRSSPQRGGDRAQR